MNGIDLLRAHGLAPADALSRCEFSDGQRMMIADGAPESLFRPNRNIKPQEINVSKAGPKEQQIADLRKRPTPTKTAAAPAAAEPKPDSPAPAAKESSVKTPTKRAAKPAAKKQAKKTPTTSRRQNGARKASAARPAGHPAEGGVRPGSKLEAIVKLLTRPQGCTTKDVLKETEWPSVSMPQQAKAAGIKLKKEKVDGVTVYRAS